MGSGDNITHAVTVSFLLLQKQNYYNCAYRIHVWCCMQKGYTAVECISAVQVHWMPHSLLVQFPEQVHRPCMFSQSSPPHWWQAPYPPAAGGLMTEA